MLQRIVTAVISFVLLLVVMYFRGWVLQLSLTVIAVWGMSEMYDAFESAGLHPVRWPGMLAAALMVPADLWLGTAAIVPLLVLVVMLSMLVITVRVSPSWTDASTTLYAAVTVLLPTMLMLSLVRVQPSLTGALMLFSVFVIAMFGDMAAFFVGVTVGKHKLNPALSPNKTWEGAVGGLLGSLLGGVLIAAIGSRYTPMPPVWHFAIVGFFGGMAGQMGDLSASLVKRWCGIKDFGVVFPGHGGVMDRFDSILFTSYVVYIYCVLCIF